MKKFAMVALAAGLAACQQQTEEPADTSPNTTAVAPENDVAMQMEQLPEPALKATLIRAILDAGLDCEGVTKVERMKDAKTPTWRATCQGGQSHLIEVSPDGTATVVSRSQ